MDKRISLFALCVALALVASDSGSTKQEDLTLCDIVASPDKYNGTEVTIRGTYRVAFEASQLYCLSCLKSGKVWVEFERSDAGSKAAADIRSRVLSLGTVNGIFTGVFQSGGAYGHLGSYNFQFTIQRAKHIQTIDHAGLPPETMDANSRSKVCQ